MSRIRHKLRSLGEREVQSRAIGELVMEELRHLDEVAYVRFASVYRSFQDLDAFRDEIERCCITAGGASRVEPSTSCRCCLGPMKPRASPRK